MRYDVSFGLKYLSDSRRLILCLAMYTNWSITSRVFNFTSYSAAAPQSNHDPYRSNLLVSLNVGKLTSSVIFSFLLSFSTSTFSTSIEMFLIITFLSCSTCSTAVGSLNVSNMSAMSGNICRS